MNENISVACRYMKEAHGLQERKYTGGPYWEHPLSVAKILTSINCPEHIIIAGLLHDVVEDTDKTIGDIEEVFGTKVARLVAEVTDVSKPSDGNRSRRKGIDRNHLAKSTYGGATIKLADLIHNTLSIVKYDKSFSVTYLKEKIELLKVLEHGDTALYVIACLVVEENVQTQV